MNIRFFYNGKYYAKVNGNMIEISRPNPYCNVEEALCCMQYIELHGAIEELHDKEKYL